MIDIMDTSKLIDKVKISIERKFRGNLDAAKILGEKFP